MLSGIATCRGDTSQISRLSTRDYHKTLKAELVSRNAKEKYEWKLEKVNSPVRVVSVRASPVSRSCTFLSSSGVSNANGLVNSYRVIRVARIILCRFWRGLISHT